LAKRRAQQIWTFTLVFSNHLFQLSQFLFLYLLESFNSFAKMAHSRAPPGLPRPPLVGDNMAAYLPRELVIQPWEMEGDVESHIGSTMLCYQFDRGACLSPGFFEAPI